MFKKMNFFALLMGALFIGSGCSTLETSDAKVTLHESFVLTESGLKPESGMTPGTYAINQVVDAGTYLRADLQAIMPGRSLPAGATVEPGESLSAWEILANSVGAIANTIPGGQPVGALAVGVALVGRIWRDKRKLKDTELAARTIGQIYDTALDINATDEDRERAREREARMQKARHELTAKAGKVRDLVDAILAATETPTKRPADA